MSIYININGAITLNMQIKATKAASCCGPRSPRSPLQNWTEMLMNQTWIMWGPRQESQVSHIPTARYNKAGKLGWWRGKVSLSHEPSTIDDRHNLHVWAEVTLHPLQQPRQEQNLTFLLVLFLWWLLYTRSNGVNPTINLAFWMLYTFHFWQFWWFP